MSMSPEIPPTPTYDLGFDLRTHCHLSREEQQRILNQTIAPEEELVWNQLGITSPNVIKGWKQRNLTPEQAADWYRRGYLPYEVDYFLERDLSPEEADFLISTDEKQVIRAQQLPPIQLSQIAAWKAYGFTFEEALIWLLNFWVRPDSAREWVNRGFDFPTGKAWRTAGVSDPQEAQVWQASGFSPDKVKLWKKNVPDANPEWVQQMLVLGLDINNEAERYLIQKLRPCSAKFWQDLDFEWAEILAWVRVGFSHSIAKSWRSAGFSPEEAKRWKVDDRINATQAREWKELGASPESAVVWRKAFGLPRNARSWLEANITPEAATSWKQANIRAEDALLWIEACVSPERALWCKKNNVTLNELLIWRKSGHEDLDRLAWWKRLGARTPEQALEWDRDSPLSPEEFERWRKVGVRDLMEANRLKDYHHTPETWELRESEDSSQWQQGEVALLFWGIPFPSPEYLDRGPWEGPETLDRWRNRFHARSSGVNLKELDCKVSCYGRCSSSEFYVPYVAIATSERWVVQAGPISLPECMPDWTDKLRQFCDVMEIPWREPGWYIAAIWNS